MADDTDMDPQRYYDDLAEGEWDRLDSNPVNRLEFETTIDYLEANRPDSDADSVRVLDAGGGPGRYTCWLAEHGYEVEHCDLSKEQVSLTKEKFLREIKMFLKEIFRMLSLASRPTCWAVNAGQSITK